MAGRKWTEEEKEILRENCKSESRQWLSDETHHPLSGVNSMLSELKLIKSNHWTTEDKEILLKVWGSSRANIQSSLPAYTWKKIRLQANLLDLPPLAVEREAVSLGSILSAMNYNSKTPNKWRKLGLKIKEDFGKGTKNNRYYVVIEDFWKLVLKNPDIIDIHRLPAGILGVEPPKIKKLRKTTDAKRVIIKLGSEKRAQIIGKYYNSNKSTDSIADEYGIRADTVRHITSASKKSGNTAQYLKKSIRRVRTESFLKKLETLYYTNGKTQKECSILLECSINSVYRGLKDIMQIKRDKLRVLELRKVNGSAMKYNVSIFSTCLGKIKILEMNNEVYSISFVDDKEPSMGDPSTTLRSVELQIIQYLKGEQKILNIKLNTENYTELQKRIYSAVNNVPYGETVNYKTLRELVGADITDKQICNCLLQNQFAIVIPCHRIIKNKSNIGEYINGKEIKKKLLNLEKV